MKRAGLLEQFRLQVARRPSAIALVGSGQPVSYAELDRRSSSVAAALHARSVSSGDLVAIGCDWPPDFLAAMLGVLKAGAAYVPLDVTQPEIRVEQLLNKVRPSLVLTTAIWDGVFAAAPCSRLHLETIADAPEPAAEPPRATDPFYVMFTSGSTGEPKAVLVSHGNLAGLFDEFTRRYSLDERDCWSQCHSVAFGFSVWEIWGALVHGARLAVLPQAVRADPARLFQFLHAHDVSILSQTPTAFAQNLLTPQFDMAANSSVRLIVLSGEPASAAVVQPWFDANPHSNVSIINTYAITEAAGQLTCQEFKPGVSDPGLGQPLDRAELYLINARGEVADEGELFVGGGAVSLGYVGDPAQTALKFIAVDAFPGQRLYRTGDYLRRRADGSLEWLGRVDAQLKWRGHRLEPAEVEAAIQAHPGVAAAAVAMRGRAGAERLVGYYVASADDADCIDAELPEFWPSVGPYQVYDTFLYDLMGSESDRLAHYRIELARSAPGRVVLDMGTGEQALLAREALRAGASHVYAVEVLPAAARRARRTIEELGLAERITVIEGDLRDVELPEPAELVVQGIVGNIGSADGIVPLWNSALRLTTTDATAIPALCETRIAPIELPEGLVENAAFAPMAATYVERIYAQTGRRFDLRLCVRNVTADALLSDPVCFERLDFVGELPADLQGSARFRLHRAGRVDGFLLWTRLGTQEAGRVDYFSTQQAWLPVFMPLPDGGQQASADEIIELAWESRTVDGLCPDYYLSGRVGGQRFECQSRVGETEVGTTAIHRAIAQRSAPALPTSVGLSDWVSARLPDYMVPTAWMKVPALPMTHHGKLDRAALPEPGRARPELGSAAAPAGSEEEEQMLTIWSAVLGIDGIGVRDDFFALGGDSVTAVRLVSELQRQVALGVSLADVFEAPSVAALAERCSRLAAAPRRYETGDL